MKEFLCPSHYPSLLFEKLFLCHLKMQLEFFSLYFSREANGKVKGIETGLFPRGESSGENMGKHTAFRWPRTRCPGQRPVAAPGRLPGPWAGICVAASPPSLPDT